MRLILFLFLLVPYLANAQYAARIFNADYQFKEGVFLSHSSWLANEPDLSWEQIEGEMVQLPEDYRVQIDGMTTKDGNRIEDVYAISLDGFPYICVHHDLKRNFHEFAGLRFRGRYAFFKFVQKEVVRKMMYAYNPANGRPFRGGAVERERDVLKEVLLHLPSGDQLLLSQQNVYNLLDDYPDLQRAVSLLDPEDKDISAKLTQAVKLYNDREPLLLPMPKKL